MNLKIESAFLLAAGRGERLRPLTDVCPKPLLLVRGKPMLYHILKRLSEIRTPSCELKRVVINAWHLKDQVKAFVQTHSRSFNFELLLSEENELLGTGGGLHQAFPILSPSGLANPLLMLNGDCIWEGQIESFIESALKDQLKDGAWWLAPEASDQTPILTEGSKITKIGKLWRSEETLSSAKEGRTGCFTGIQVFRRWEPHLLPSKGCIIRDYWIPRLQKGAHLGGNFEGLVSWQDLGTIERYEAAK